MLAERKGNRLLVSHIDALGWAFRYVRERHPFRLEAVVVLPDHLHCIWTLPSGDSYFSMRWNVLKGHVSRAIDEGERISQSREKRRERGLWQRRFWEHLLRDQDDFNKHVDYIRRDMESRRRSRGARDRRASTGEAGDASRRKVSVGAVSHRAVVRRCGRRTVAA
ncbi:MAG: REP-associated tyrosine transposase [Gammaproteobacteria bacterium]